MTDTPISVTITAVLTGRAAPLAPTRHLSGIAKQMRDGAVAVTPTGLAGDEQGDPRHHGGPEKAIHHYPFDHYAAWARDIDPPPALLAQPGAFGENVSTSSLTERDVCLGDVFRLGSALVQVSQGRQPCWKLNPRFGRASMAREVQSAGRTGWYYRVLEPGRVASGDALTLMERPCAEWPLGRVLDLLYRDTLNRAALQALAMLPHCPPAWRPLIERRLATGHVEDWSKRLAGQA